MKEIERKLKQNPEPVVFFEEMVNSLSGEQKQILINLDRLVKEEQRLIDEIESRRPTPSGIVRLPEGITVCEDEDDWRVITARSRLNLKRIREEIVQTLKKALNCGLAHLEVIQKQCANYGINP